MKELEWISNQQDVMEDMLNTWALINTGTENTKGLSDLAEHIKSAFLALDCSVEVVTPAKVQELTDQGTIRDVPVGQCLRFFKTRKNTPKVLLVGHMDTVFPIHHHFQTLTPLPERCLKGPGVTDMKGGILVMLHALLAFEKTKAAENLSWEVFLNADEETGSRGSMPAMLKSAQTADYGLGYEPCMPHGALAGQRKGSANYAILVKGKAAHAGREFHIGKNAITALCRFLLQLDEFNTTRPSVTINIAAVSGGGPLNIVPDTVVGRFNIRIESQDDQVWFEEYIQKAIEKASTDGFRFELFGGFTRPPKLIDKPTQDLSEIVRQCGQQLGLTIEFEATGGCCDGNNLAAAGVPTIDTLGVRGAHIHSDQEFIHLDSLSERAKLSFLILTALSEKGLAATKAELST